MRTYGRLREDIKNQFGKLDNFAEAMNMDSSTLSKKLNDRTPWTRSEIEEACKLLGKPMDKVHEYFFYE